MSSRRFAFTVGFIHKSLHADAPKSCGPDPTKIVFGRLRKKELKKRRQGRH